MSKFLTSKAKYFYFAFGILMFVTLIASLFYMSQYAHIHVYYVQSPTGSHVIARDTEDALGNTNQLMWDFFEETSDTTFAKDFNQYKEIVFDYQQSMSSFNNIILYYALTGIVCFAILLVLSNHNRRIYYKSNLYGGIILPGIVSIFSIVMIIMNTMLMGTFNNNFELFNRVSVLQNPDTKVDASKQINNIQYLKDLYSCDSTTYIIYDVLFLLVCLYSIFLIATAIIKYKATGKERKEIIEKVVMSND